MKINKKFIFVVTIIGLFISIASISAKVRLPKLFTNNMVLQRDMPVKIWGWADAGEEITITFLENEYSTVTSSFGAWEIKLPSQKAGGPVEIEVVGNNSIKLENILFGDVWICSGQSNMYFRTAAAKNSYRDINDANYKKIRLFQIDKDSHYQPKEDLASGKWLECSPKTVRGFSAVAYFFGRELHKEIDVPIGLIHTSWGGSSIQAWMDGETIKKFPDYHDEVLEIEKTPNYFEQLEQEYENNGGNLLVSEIFKQDTGLNDDGSLSSSEFFTEGKWNEIKVPGYWEDLGLEDYDGTVWYRKQFEIPDAFRNNDLQIDLGWIDDYNFTFFNGEKLGQTYYKGSERRYTIPTERVKKEANEILICVYDKGGKGGFWGPRKSHLKIKDDNSGLNLDLQGLWKFKVGSTKANIELNLTKTNKQPQKRAVPTFLYNAMIAPLTDYSIKGAIWFQGESNAGNGAEYAKLLPAMIEGWRDKWNQGNFPFLIVQLANYGNPDTTPGQSNWSELQEAQLKTLKVPNTGLAVTVDLGDAMDIHPKNKQDVGHRVMLSAMKVAYGKSVVGSGPIYKSMEVIGGKVVISFTNVGSGLLSKSKFGYLNEFAIAGEDKKFVWAKAFIQDNKVVVYCDDIPKPIAVRYAWSGNPDEANLYNMEGLPASPFRTDVWK